MNEEDFPLTLARKKDPMKILIASPAYGGMVHQDYVHSFLKTFVNAADERIGIGTYLLGNESLIPRARNRLASAALDGGYDKIFFIDSDIAWTWEDAKKLIDAPYLIIGGACPLKTYPITLNFNVLPQHQHYFAGLERTPESLESLRKAHGPIVPVKNIGTAFLMIDCRVLTGLKPYVEEYDFPDHTTGQMLTQHDFFPCGVIDSERPRSYLSEDFGFQWLAGKFGFETHLHTEVIVSHTGGHTFAAR